jgi:hypothetical protein
MEKRGSIGWGELFDLLNPLIGLLFETILFRGII